MTRISSLIVLGSIFIAFGGPFVLFFCHIYSEPQLLSLFLLGSLSSLLGFILTAVIWKFVTDAIDIIYISLIGSFLQEFCRFIMIRHIYRKIERTYNQCTTLGGKDGAETFHLCDSTSSLATGVGYGSMKSLLIYGNLLSKHLNSADKGLNYQIFHNTPGVPDLIGISTLSLYFFLLDLVLMPISFVAEKRSESRLVCTVFFLRLSATSCMFLNQMETGLAYSSGGLLLIIFIAAGVLRDVYPLIIRGQGSENHRCDAA